jgi:Gram-negative bacterial TonB protein C-terminal
MTLLALNLQERPPAYLGKRLPPGPFKLGSANLNRGVVPYRGLSYSVFLHHVAVVSVLFLPSLDSYFRMPALPVGDQLFAINLNHQAKLIYFPPVQAKEEGEKRKNEGEESQPKPQPLKARSLRTKGLSYPGPQAIISDVPNATNKFQTVLQPKLANPPIIRMPTPLPNVLQIADAGPLPKPPEPPKPEPTVAKKDLMVPTPSQVQTQRSNVVLPSPTAAPTLPVPERPVEPPTAVRKDLTVPAPTLSTSQRPKVVLPLGPAAPALPVPEKPIELTAARKDLAVPSPSQAAPSQRANIALPNANSAPVLPAPERPIEPPTAVKKDLTIPVPSQVQSQRANVVLPAQTAAPALPVPERPVEPPTVVKKDLTIPAPSQVESSQRTRVLLPGQAAPTVAPPAQIAAVDTHGSDQQNVVSISPLPAPPGQGAIPAAEARGRFAISPEPNLTASGGAPGVKADDLPKPMPGVGKRPDGVPGTAPTGNSGGAASGTADKGTGTKTDDGTGTGARGSGPGNAPAKSPFGGITVQGGRLSGTGGVSAAPPSREITTSPSAPAPGGPTSYGMTVVANAGSGGGLPDLGVFAKEQVYTVFIDMRTKTGVSLPSWTLQYALIPSTPNATGVVPPFPITKEPPVFPVDLIRKYPRSLVIVYALIDAKGKLQQVAVKESPDPQLNPLALAALSKWTFRAAEVSGIPVSVKVLLGIPVLQ